MPWIGGRLGWNEPPPAATTTHFASKVLPASVLQAEQRLADLLQRRHHFVEVKRRPERLDLLHQRFGQPMSGDVRNAGNVVDRLLRIKLGALPADLVEDVDQMRLDVEQAELEHREQADRPRADDHDVGLDGVAHSLYSRLRPAPLAVMPAGAQCAVGRPE